MGAFFRAFGSMEPVLGIGLAFFIVYQIVDSVSSANAIRMGQPPPDPFGLSRTFGVADRFVAPGSPVVLPGFIGGGHSYELCPQLPWS